MRSSGTQDSNQGLQDLTDKNAAGDNLAFFRDALDALAARGIGNRGLMAIGLIGQRDLPGVTLRWAQSILRWDLRPSLWSHVFLIAQPVEPGDDLAQVRILEVPLHDRTGRFPRPERNGVSESWLGVYANPLVDANAALLGVSMNGSEAEAVLAQASEPNRDRMRYDLWETLGIWQTYLWSAGARPNPLREGFPISASAFVEYAFESVELDLAPGASERHSAPEHLWNAAKWWHLTFEGLDHAIAGSYVLRDKGCALLAPDDVPEPQQPSPVPWPERTKHPRAQSSGG